MFSGMQSSNKDMQNRKWKYLLKATGSLILIAVACLSPAPLLSSSNLSKTVAQYKVSSMGLSIGDVTTTQHMTDECGQPGIQFETRTAVKASFLWLGYRLETVEKGILVNGDLVSYARKGRENGTVIDVEGRLENSSFRFDVREQGGARSLVIPRNSYDYTTMECPEARLDFADRSQVTLRILDVEKMAVVRRDYQLVKTAHYAIGDRKLPCRIVDYSDRNKKARRWITWDGTTVVMYRQDSRGDKNPYSVQATSVTREL
jgi:hypothetical protein